MADSGGGGGHQRSSGGQGHKSPPTVKIGLLGGVCGDAAAAGACDPPAPVAVPAAPAGSDGTVAPSPSAPATVPLRKFQAAVRWVKPAARAGPGPTKVDLTVQVQAATAEAATLLDLKEAVMREGIRSQGVRLPVERQSVILRGKQLADDAQLIAPLGIVGGGNGGGGGDEKSKLAAVPFVVCKRPEPVTHRVTVELSHLLRPPPAIARSGEPWVVETEYKHGVTTFGHFIISLVRAHGKLQAGQSDVYALPGWWSPANLVLFTNGVVIGQHAGGESGQSPAQAAALHMQALQRLLATPMAPATPFSHLALVPNKIPTCFAAVSYAGGGEVARSLGLRVHSSEQAAAYLNVSLVHADADDGAAEASTADAGGGAAGSRSSAPASFVRVTVRTPLKPSATAVNEATDVPSMADSTSVPPALDWVGEAWRVVYMVGKIGSRDKLRIAPPQFAPLSAAQLKLLVHEQCPDMPPDIQRLISQGQEFADTDVVTLGVTATPMEKDDSGRCPGCTTSDIYLIKRVLSTMVQLTVFDGTAPRALPPSRYQFTSANRGGTPDKPTVLDLKNAIRRQNAMAGGTLKVFVGSTVFDNDAAPLESYGVRLDGSMEVCAMFNPTTYANATGGLTASAGSGDGIITDSNSSMSSFNSGTGSGPIILGPDGTNYTAAWKPPPDVSHGKPLVTGIIGLNQMGNTCYLNSSLQCLAQMQPFVEFFTAPKTGGGSGGGGSGGAAAGGGAVAAAAGGGSEGSGSGSRCDAAGPVAGSAGTAKNQLAMVPSAVVGVGLQVARATDLARFGPLSITRALQGFMRNVWDPGVNSVTPRRVKAAVARCNAEFAGFGQQDAAQLLDTVLGAVDNEARAAAKAMGGMGGGSPGAVSRSPTAACGGGSSKPDAGAADKRPSLASIVQATCTGKMRSTVTCMRCGTVSVLLDDFTCLPIPVHAPRPRGGFKRASSGAASDDAPASAGSGNSDGGGNSSHSHGGTSGSGGNCGAGADLSSPQRVPGQDEQGSADEQAGGGHHDDEAEGGQGDCDDDGARAAADDAGAADQGGVDHESAASSPPLPHDVLAGDASELEQGAAAVDVSPPPSLQSGGGTAVGAVQGGVDVAPADSDDAPDSAVAGMVAAASPLPVPKTHKSQSVPSVPLAAGAAVAAGSSAASATSASRPAISATPLDLGACFEAFGDVDDLDGDNAYFCEKCQQRTHAKKQLSLHTFPRYLIVQLKRFYYERSGASFVSRKIHTPVRYPVRRLLFDDAVPTHLRGDDQRDPRFQMPATSGARAAAAQIGAPPAGMDAAAVGEEIGSGRGGRGAAPAPTSAPAPAAVPAPAPAPAAEYRLCGVVNHFGSAQGGHYTATVRHCAGGAAAAAAGSGGAGGASAAAPPASSAAAAARSRGPARWYNCNDSSTKAVVPNAARSPNAYLLFYERVEPPQSAATVSLRGGASRMRNNADRADGDDGGGRASKATKRTDQQHDAEAVAVAAELVAAVTRDGSGDDAGGDDAAGGRGCSADRT